MMAGKQAALAFTEWAEANTSKIHADSLDEAAMGFAAGWDAASTDLEAQVAVLVGALDMAMDTLALDEELPRPTGKLKDWVERYGDVTDSEILVRLRKIRADIPAAAKELLAQGERLRRIDAARRECGDQCNYLAKIGSACEHMDEILAAIADIPAALSPGEGE